MQCNRVVESPSVFETPDLSLRLPRFKTLRTEMLAVQFAIAQRAQEPAATVAGENGFPCPMEKTSRCTFDQYDFSTRNRSVLAEHRRKNLDLQQTLTRRAWFQVRLVERRHGQGRPALWTFQGQH